MKILGKTDIGLVRETNQDAFTFGSFDDGNCWAVVCDGMGGVSGGQVASEICVERVSEAIKRSYRSNMTLSSAKNLLTTAINAANSAVFKQAQENLELKGMGTTVVALVIRIFHTDDFINLAEFFQQNFASCLFPAKLTVIGHILKLATAAFFCERTSIGVGF